MNQKCHPSPDAQKGPLLSFPEITQKHYSPDAERCQRWKSYSKPRDLHLNLIRNLCCWPKIWDGDSYNNDWKKAVLKEANEEGRADGPCQTISLWFWYCIQVTSSLNSICAVSPHVSTDLSGWLTLINQRCEHSNLPFEHFVLKIILSSNNMAFDPEVVYHLCKGNIFDWSS